MVLFTNTRLALLYAAWRQIVCDCDTQIVIFFATWKDMTVHFILRQLIAAADVQNRAQSRRRAAMECAKPQAAT